MMRSRRTLVRQYPLSVAEDPTPTEATDERTCLTCDHYRDNASPSCGKYMMSVGSAIVGYKDGSAGPCGFDRYGWADKDRFGKML